MLGFVLPATLFLKTHEVAVREAYRQAKSVYNGGTESSSNHPAHQTSVHSAGADSIHLHSTVHSEDIVVNPVKNLWPTDRDPSPVQQDEETAITFSHFMNHVDDTKDGEINLSSSHVAPVEGKSLCNAVNVLQNTIVWRMIIPFRQFWLPFFMIFFGFVSLIVGVMTVFRDSS